MVQAGSQSEEKPAHQWYGELMGYSYRRMSTGRIFAAARAGMNVAAAQIRIALAAIQRASEILA